MRPALLHDLPDGGGAVRSGCNSQDGAVVSTHYMPIATIITVAIDRNIMPNIARRAARPATVILLGVSALALAGCMGGGDRPQADIAASQVTTIGVNAYLWRASLDALSFAPLLQADANGGVIITDWYANPQNPTERVKLTVAILDRDLRADALRVSGTRQVSQNGAWVDAPLQAATVQRVEEIILTRARDLRRTAIDN